MTSKADGSTPAAKGLDGPRLIERAFPLKQASLDSVHEKNVRHRHISTLHIWPARRPLAACRAALIATLLPDPGTPEKRKEILERLAGKVVQVTKKKKLPNGQVKVEHKDETVGGILHWGRESGPDLEWFREEIRKAYGGRAPRVLDPFAGGGAIPLEAMRLGCEVTASDINPVAWFILKCTLEYPQRLAGQKRPLPGFALESPDFMRDYFKGTGKYTKKQLDGKLSEFQTRLLAPPEADLAWHVRAWGWWVLQKAKKDLDKYYPTIDGKPTVAYLWARTVTCKNCRATIPLLKTQWLCNKDNKRVLLTIEHNADHTLVVLGIQTDVPFAGGNAAQRREHEKRIGQGTMTRNGAWCPCCGQPGTVAMAMEDIRQEGLVGRLGAMITAVVVDGPDGKEYRFPTLDEVRLAAEAENELDCVFAEVPFGLPDEPLPSKEALGFRVPLYGFDKWRKLFTPRQLVAIGTFVKHTRAVKEVMQSEGYQKEWVEAVTSFLASAISRFLDFNSTLCTWILSVEAIRNTFVRYALPMSWDFGEAATINDVRGGYIMCVDKVANSIETIQIATRSENTVPQVRRVSATRLDVSGGFDIVCTDPPYYDAISYSDLMDYFYVWLRRTLEGLSAESRSAFQENLSPKWDYSEGDGELIDDSSRFGGDKGESRRVYEDGMYRAFQACNLALEPHGRLVIVFAHKQPDAWEALVWGIVKAGFVVDASWPIQTEQAARMRAIASAALSSSVWLVCRKRPESARAGWDNQVLEEMRSKIHDRLREFWDAGIRGPDFVWAATGPALEVYSMHPIVKKANEPGAVMTVSEFLRHVRRIVVDFVVGRVLTKDGDGSSVSGLDDITTYYLLHRNDFGFNDAPAGACILYSVSCGLSDSTLVDDYDILFRTGGREKEEDEEGSSEEPGETEIEEGSGSTFRLKSWNQRKGKTMGDDVNGRPAPLVDRVHRLMHLWRAGDAAKVDEFLDEHGLWRQALFHQILQALIELSEAGSEERSLLESVSNHIAAKGGTVKKPKTILEYTDPDSGGGKPK